MIRLSIALILFPVAFAAYAGDDFAQLLESDPMSAFLISVRTGEVEDPEAMRERVLELLNEDLDAARVGAWACWSAEISLEVTLDPVLMEFGSETFIPLFTDICIDQGMVRAILMRPLHFVSMQMEPEKTDDLLEFVVQEWSTFSHDNRVLALQVLGKLGLDVTGRLSRGEIREAGAASLLRYCSELGIEREDRPETGLFLIERLYAARCTPSGSLSVWLGDPYWAVRFTAAEKAATDDLLPLLEDSVAYVRLTAALRLSEEGSEEAAVQIREMVHIQGPIGHRAVYGLHSDDRDLLMQLLESPENGKRTAALETWFERELPLDEATIRELSRNDHWLVPLFLAWLLDERKEYESALLVHETVMEDTSRYDEPVQLVMELESLLEISGENEDPPPQELPFDPDTVRVPDKLMLATDCGQFEIVLWKDIAPVTCANFTWLSLNGFYDGIWFHRVIPGFVAQAGCPDGTGMGGPGYAIPNERSLRSFERGVLGMADAGLNTGGSQFFIMLDDHNRLDGRYTAFGELVSAEGLDDITVGTRILWIGEYRH